MSESSVPPASGATTNTYAEEVGAEIAATEKLLAALRRHRDAILREHHIWGGPDWHAIDITGTSVEEARAELKVLRGG